MKQRLKDRIGDVVLILLFLAVIGGAAYAIVKTMTRWTAQGLGF